VLVINYQLCKSLAVGIVDCHFFYTHYRLDWNHDVAIVYVYCDVIATELFDGDEIVLEQ